MYSARKKNFDISKRHIRRIIANETAIDIAGSSTQINELIADVNTFDEKNDIDLNEKVQNNTEQRIITYSVLHNNTHCQHENNNIENNNVEEYNDNRSHPYSKEFSRNML